MRGFDDERERIRDSLRETGRDPFARYGLDKTTIADLTDPADIANGTFYRFYDSKEGLCFEVLCEEGLSPEEGIVAFRTCSAKKSRPAPRAPTGRGR